MSEVNNKDIKAVSMASFWSLYYQLWIYFTPYSSVFIVDFKQVNVHLIGNMYIFDGQIYDTSK